MRANRLPGNCVIAALAAWLCAPACTRIRLERNRCGRWHVYWQRGGKTFEFYGRGASKRSYLGNLIYLGTVKEIAR